MKIARVNSIYLAVMALVMPQVLRGQTDGSVTFRVTTQDPADVSYNPKNIMAIWVTTGTGEFVKTLKKRANNREQYLYQWIADSNRNTTDAVTGATLSTHQTHNVTWDCRNASGNLVADGTYRMRVEFTTRNGQGPYTASSYIEFTKGASPVTLNPANYNYTSSPYTGSPEFVDMQLTYTPSGIPHDIAVSSLDVPAEVIAGDSVTVTVTVDNQTVTAEANIGVELRNTTTDTLIGTQTIVALAGGGSVQKTFTWDTTGLPRGGYILMATAAPVSGEGATSNNERSASVTVRGPQHDLAATAISVATRVAPGTTPTVTVAVTNAGDFAETFAVVLSDLTANAVVATQTVASLAAGAAQNLTFAWNSAGLSQGAHQLKAIAGPLATEWDLANNAAHAWTTIGTGTVAQTLIARGSDWEYNDLGIDLHASNWKMSGYYSGQWKSGPAQLGYENGEATLISFGDDATSKYPCYYFRRTFIAAAVPEALSAGLVRDDGAVVYINGREAIRDKMDPGPTQYDQYATGTAVGGADEGTFWPFTLDPSLVVPGINVVAVEVHQINATSSDLSFDFELTATMPVWLAQPDIAVTDVSLHDGIAGDVIDVEVVVVNKGNVPTTFAVALDNLDGGGIIDSMQVDDLLPGSTGHVHFNWATLGLAQGNYRLQGSVSGVSGDANPANDALAVTGTVASMGFVREAAAVAGSIGGYCTDVAVEGGTAYVVAGASLVALNVSIPESPSVLGRLHLTGLGRKLEVAGSYAYVACGKDGVQIVDISSPTALVHRLTYNTSGHAGDVAISGNTLCIADGARGLRIVDVTDPAHPTLSGVAGTGGAAHAVVVSGATAYVADDLGVLIVDISAAGTPVALGRVDGIGFGQALALSGTTLYVGDGAGVLSVVDVAIPASAAVSGHVRMPAPVTDLVLKGSLVYAAVGASGVALVDASTPAAPSLSGTVATGDETTGLAWLGTYICLSDGYAGMRIIVPVVFRPTVIGAYTDVSRSRSSAVSGAYAYLAAGNEGVRVYDVSAPHAPVFIASSTVATNARDVAVSSNILYVADGQYGLALLDVSTPAAPSPLGRYASTELGGVRCVAVSGTDVVITDGHRVERVSASAPGSPVFTHAYAADGYVYSMAWQDGHVLLAAGRSGLVVLNAADLSTAAALPLEGCAVDVTAAGDHVFVAAGDGGWKTIDISNPLLPVLVGSRTAEREALALTATVGRLHVADAVSTATALDISQPLTPVPLGVSGPLARCMHLGSSAGLVIASEDEGGAALLVEASGDADGDGLDDSWEQQIVDADPDDGINSIADVLAGDDFDGDGLSNGAEALAGTSPTDAGSVFALTSPGAAELPGDFILRWYSVAGKRYSVLRSASLGDGFLPIATGIAATPPVTVYTTTVSSVSAYYMIVVE